MITQQIIAMNKTAELFIASAKVFKKAWKKTYLWNKFYCSFPLLSQGKSIFVFIWSSLGMYQGLTIG